MTATGRRAEVYQVFEVLRELAGLVEGARAVPLSASCVVPRDYVLDLIEDLREALPSELDDAQAVISAQDELLGKARDRVERATERAEAAKERALAQARAEVHGMITAAQQEADRIVADARSEHDRLVAATEVHQAAATEADRLLAEAREESHRLVTEARGEAHTLVSEAQAEADALANEADEYADARLAALADTLGRTLRTVEKGRQSLRGRGTGAAARTGGPPPGATDRPKRLAH